MSPLHRPPSAEMEATEVQKNNILNESTRPKYRWNVVLMFIILHSLALYAVYLIIFQNKWHMFLFTWTYGTIQGLGITAGAHRLWSHRSYKARLPLKFFLLLCQTSAFQHSVHRWVKDHRLHHKFTDTDADPHNSARGLFFSHMGWLLISQKKDIAEKGKLIDMSDIESDKMLMWQYKYYPPLMVLFTFIVPPCISYTCFFSHHGIWNNIVIVAAFRFIYSVHSSWLINSVSHSWGMRPYDRSISPSENRVVSFFAHGEGFHNYHHVFPWDYKAAELGNYSLNWSLMFINMCKKIGLAYDCKTVPPEYVMKRATRTGDGSWRNLGVDNSGIWGWGDTSMCEEDIKNTNIVN